MSGWVPYLLSPCGVALPRFLLLIYQNSQFWQKNDADTMCGNIFLPVTPQAGIQNFLPLLENSTTNNKQYVRC